MYAHDLLTQVIISSSKSEIRDLACVVLRLVTDKPILLIDCEESSIRAYFDTLSLEEFNHNREVLVLSAFIRSCKK
jgi:hypothetical protein